jgi:bifunctional UDP-N-acetylglucosamine pyrophosphorylase / glucosamine-1-phosphate N-acetyltransferase
MVMTKKNPHIIETLVSKGVVIPNPGSVEIGEEVNPERISGNGVVIHAGCKIFGKNTLILDGARLGYEAPATVCDCYIGPDVQLNGGFFKQAVFLKNASVGSCAHVREGTIFEEASAAAHAVGLKQTILFPFVTLGSQINFCDCLMSGGTGKKNHSEVGSSYIHFNFTPQQDKATASLVGDVPRGVMLNQPPIFLGGQGGLVGPALLTFGITVAAGTICRKDELRPHRLIFGGAGQSGNIHYIPGAYTSITRILKNNIIYIANLLALMQWYQVIRFLFISDEFPTELHQGLVKTLDLAIDERITRLAGLMEKLSEAASDQQHDLIGKWPEMLAFLRPCQTTSPASGDRRLKNLFADAVRKGIRGLGADYVSVIQSLSPEESQTGTLWLQGIVDQVTNRLILTAEPGK